jgi:hypothetical protein
VEIFKLYRDNRRIMMRGRQNVVFFALVLSISFFLCSTAFAGFFNNGSRRTYPTQGGEHTGLYVGSGLGLEVPTGPDKGGFSTGFGWAVRIGYQFIRNLAVELGYDQGIGNISQNGATGTWDFMELPYIDIKPIIPLSSASDLYFLVGIAYADNSASITNPNFTVTLGPDIGIDLGVGYEYYITNNWSLGGEVIYHYLTTTKLSVASTSLGVSITRSSSAADGSATSANFAFLYHF